MASPSQLTQAVWAAVLRHGALFLFAATLVSCFGQLDRKPSGDTYPTVYAAVAIVRDQSLRLDPYLPEIEQRAGVHPYQVAAGDDGHTYSYQPVAPAIFAVPAVAVLALAGVDPDDWDTWMEAGMFTGAAVTAGAVALFFLLLTRLTTRTHAFVASAVLAWATPAWTIAGQALWAHGPVLLALVAALLAIVDRRFALAGFALGSMVALRPATAVIAVALVPLLLRGREPVVRAALGALPPLLAVALYNRDAFGCVTCTGYAGTFTEDKGFHGTFWHGLTGNLVSPGRGLFVFAPVLLFALPGAWLGRRTAIYRWSAVALLAFVLLISKWFEWWGGETFGPRLLVDALPLFCLLLVPALDRWAASSAFRWTFGVLAAWSVAVELLGAALWPGTGWYDTHAVRSFGTWWHPTDTDLTAFFDDPHRLLTRGGTMLLVMAAAGATGLVVSLAAGLGRRRPEPARERN